MRNIRTKHTNIFCGQNAEFFIKLKQGAQIESPGFKRLKANWIRLHLGVTENIKLSTQYKILSFYMEKNNELLVRSTFCQP